MAKEKDDKYRGQERRSERRSLADRYFSVEFSIENLDPVYQFQIRETSLSGLCVLVKEGSAVLDHLKVGDVLNLKYNPSNLTKQPEHLSTEIKHITKDDRGRFKGHYMVGLALLGKEQSDMQGD